MKNHKVYVIILLATVAIALSALSAAGQAQNTAPFEKQFISLWSETYTQLQPARWGGLNPPEVSAMQTTGVPFFLLDVRTAAEFQTERIAGAVNIPLDQLPLRLNEMPADREAIVVVYCKVGHRGDLGFTVVRQYGYANAKNMIGGIDAWKTAGLPVDPAPVVVPPFGPQTAVLPPFEKQFVSLWDETLTQLKSVKWGSISTTETNALVTTGVPFLALDVRTSAEFTSGHVPGAVNIPLDQLPARLGELPKDHEAIVVVYCKVGQRGGLGFAMLRQFGFVNAKNMVGGFDAWKAAGLPVEY